MAAPRRIWHYAYAARNRRATMDPTMEDDEDEEEEWFETNQGLDRGEGKEDDWFDVELEEGQVEINDINTDNPNDMTATATTLTTNTY